jgi:hypothetical protein
MTTCSFEKAVQNKLRKGLTLKMALSEASSENPTGHQFFIDRENDPLTRKGFARHDESEFKSFAGAVDYISATEGLTLGASTRIAAGRYPGLHREFIAQMARAAEVYRDDEQRPKEPTPAEPQATPRRKLQLSSTTIKRRPVFITAPVEFK